MEKQLLEHTWLAVIAGGQGTRLFPLSHNSRPKQFCHLNKDDTFIQATIKRFLGLGIKPNHVVIITTNKNQTELATSQTASLGIIPQNIYEISPHYGYAGSMVKAAEFIKKLDDSAIIVNTPADQFIVADENFEQVIAHVVENIDSGGEPTIVGVKTSDLVTVMGCGHALYDPDEKDNDGILFHVASFVEKPDEETATRLMREDNSVCNTGINVWKAEQVLSSTDPSDLEEFGLGTDDLMRDLLESFYGNIHVAVGKFIWRDCGTLKSLYDVSEDAMTPNHKNVSLGKGHIERTDCRRSLFYNIRGTNLRVTGVEDAAVLVTEIEDNIIIAIVKLSESQRVRELAEDYNTNKKFLTDDFSVGARNNMIVRSNFSEQVKVGFVGVDNYIVYTHKHEDGTIDIAVSAQV